MSLYDIKAGTEPDDARVDKLAAALLSLIERNEQREAERLLLASEKRSAQLSPEALRFLATAEFLASRLRAEPELEWSPATIGICKAFEIEIINRIIRPLAERSQSYDLSEDMRDKDLGKVATFCGDPRRKPPELGAVGHFLLTAAHVGRRRETSVILRTFLQLARDWSGSQWILDPAGLAGTISKVTAQYRNPAAHIDELRENDYRACREVVVGPDGALWRLALAVEKHK